MVVFACNSCGTSLKKNQVDKHVFQCHCSSISCMDCQKDFGIKEYGAHIKCISEEEKYAGVGWKAPANFNKGENKQIAWVDTVNETLKKSANSLSPACRSLLQAISKHDNVPRKKAKFLNFVKNVSKNRFDERTIDNVWTLLEEQWKSQATTKKTELEGVNSNGQVGQVKELGKENDVKAENESESVSGTNKDNGDENEQKLSKREKKETRRKNQHKQEKKEQKMKSSESEEKDLEKVNVPGEDDRREVKESKKERKKRKRLESATELEKKKSKEVDHEELADEANQGQIQDEEGERETDREFKWGTIIKEVLMKQPDHEISLKKLKKKIFAEYYAVVGDSKGSKTQDELVSKLNKKLKKSQFKVLKDSVKLVE